MNLCKVFIFNSLLFFTPTVILAAQSIDIFEPRQYGYVLGDIFERKMILKSPNDTSVLIDEKKIIGRVNNWLSIRKVDINKHAHFSHSIDVQYQVVNVPAKPLMVVVPSLNIKTVSNGVSESIKTTELLVTLAPITPEVVINREGLLNIQPNNQIPQIRTDTLSFRISIWLSLLLIPFLVLFYSWAPWQGFFFQKKTSFFSSIFKNKKTKQIIRFSFLE